MIDYVLGFAFSGFNELQVLLIEKKKPEWQAGKLNGVGGKVEGCELFEEAMAREFEEETGVTVPRDVWVRVATMLFPDARVVVFATALLPCSGPTSTTDEKVGFESVHELPGRVLPNLRWLIPMAINRLMGREMSAFTIELK